MPWKEFRVQDQKLRFVAAWEESECSRTELCRAFGISRQTGYRLIERYRRFGVAGLVELSRAPKSHPNRTPHETVEGIVELRRRHPTWGPRKLVAWLEHRRPDLRVPSPSTVGAALKARGLVRPRRGRRRTATPTPGPRTRAEAPNDVWAIDFKGWFRTGDGKRCDPLTVTDSFSRFALVCQAVPRPSLPYVRPSLEQAFREYGLPRVMLSDNGPPFASTGLGGLSRLAIWLIRLGVSVERIEPSKPQQNGRHERFHRTLKQETARPARRSTRSQQRAFNRFRREYNEERPHEALGQKTPASVYRASDRSLPRRLPELEYPSRFEVRRVFSSGQMKWRGRHVFLTGTLAGETVGLEPCADSWRVHFGPHVLGLLDEKTMKVVGPSRLGGRA